MTGRRGDRARVSLGRRIRSRGPSRAPVVRREHRRIEIDEIVGRKLVLRAYRRGMHRTAAEVNSAAAELTEEARRVTLQHVSIRRYRRAHGGSQRTDAVARDRLEPGGTERAGAGADRLRRRGPEPAAGGCPGD